MKIKTAASGCLLGIAIMLLVHQYSTAQVLTNVQTLPVGVVDVRRALRDCSATAKYRERTNAENAKMKDEMGQLDDEINALSKGLGALRPGSSDYLS